MSITTTDQYQPTVGGKGCECREMPGKNRGHDSECPYVYDKLRALRAIIDRRQAELDGRRHAP
jgi:hypothetical protein